MIKSKKAHTCWYCKKIIPKGSYCFGKNVNYAKTCIICKKEKGFPDRILRLRKLLKETKEDIKMLNKNMEKYERVNILAKLENGY